MVDKRVKKKIDGRFSSDSIPMRIKDLRKRLGVDQKALAEDLGVSQGTISEWESGDHTVPPIALMAIGRMDYDNTEWWYEQAGPRFAERLKLTRVIQEVRAERLRVAEQTGQSQTAAMDVSWDPELLAWVIETIEAGLKGRARPDPDKYASAVIACYEVSHRAGARDAAMVSSILKVA